jgi:hypothetical protein
MTAAHLRNLAPSDVAAWWGAVVATAVLAWDVVKFRKTAASVRVIARPNMQLFGPEGMNETKLVLVTATNHGGQPTTITHVVAFHYPSWLARILRRPDMQGAIPQPISSPLPKTLGPGEIWTGFIDQADLVEKSPAGGHTYCGVNHSLAKHPVLVRVEIT